MVSYVVYHFVCGHLGFLKDVHPLINQLSLLLKVGYELRSARNAAIPKFYSNQTLNRALFQGIFDGECRVVHPRESACAPSVVIPIYPPRDVPVDLHIKAFVGYKGNG